MPGVIFSRDFTLKRFTIHHSMSYQFSPELDRARLEELYMGDPSIACEVFGAFIKDTVSVIPHLEQSFTSNDTQEFRKLLHKLKPGFLYVGLTSIFEKMSWAEERCSTVENLEVLMPQFTEIMLLIEEKVPVVRQELKNLQELATS